MYVTEKIHKDLTFCYTAASISFPFQINSTFWDYTPAKESKYSMDKYDLTLWPWKGHLKSSTSFTQNVNIL